MIINLSTEDWIAIQLTITLSSATTLILLCIGTPLAWWLARSACRLKPVIGALVTLPLILPPTVLGFYLLVLMGPYGWIGQFTDWLGIQRLAFSFSGMLVASVLYSMPFVVQPLQNTFSTLNSRLLEAAATLQATPWDRFIKIIFPLSRSGFITAGVLGFAHTVGEFGAVLMVGGNIPNQTRVVSMQIYNHVEAMQYQHAHTLSALMVAFAFLALFWTNLAQRKKEKTK